MLWARMWRVTHRGNREKAAPVRAVACVDSALWDLIADSGDGGQAFRLKADSDSGRSRAAFR